MKKLFISLFFSLISLTSVFADAPEVNCAGLPGCEKWWAGDAHADWPIEAIVYLVWLLIQYVAVLAVIVLMISGIMYLVSGW